jgi:hypothetical protein
MQVLVNTLDSPHHADGQRVLHVIDQAVELEIRRSGERYCVTMWQLGAEGGRAFVRQLASGIETVEEARERARQFCRAAIDRAWVERDSRQD